MSFGNDLGWERAGPVAEAYGESRDPIAVCVGPTGGGKTTESARRTFRIAQWQHPSPRDGIRKARIIVLAPTYRRIWDQVIPSYRKVITWWNARDGKDWKGGVGEPAAHVYDALWREPYSGLEHKLHVEVLFRAPGDGDLEEFFRGLEATAFWLPEMDTHESEDLLSLASNRVGRYPEPDDRPDDLSLPPAYAGIYGDANAPPIGSWFHERFFLKRRASDRLFLQPPGYDDGSPDGFHPLAENQRNLRKISRTYYKDRAATHEDHDVERLLKNRPGYSRHGKPVHPLFNAITMSAPDGFDPDPNLPVVIGMDAGSNTLRHSAVFMQRTWGGQVRVLHEYAPEGQTDIVEAAEAIKTIRETRFAACSEVEIVVDPAARGQSAASKGISWVMMLRQMTGLNVRPAPTNAPTARRGAINDRLAKQAGPGVPAFMVSAPHCPVFMRGMSGGYHFERKNGRIGIGEAEWELIRPHVTTMGDGRRYLTQEAVTGVPDDALLAWSGWREGRGPRSAALEAARDDLTMRLRTLITATLDDTLTEPRARERVGLTRGLKPGTVAGEAVRFMTQFLGFSQAVIGRHVAPAMRGYAGQSPVSLMAHLIVASTALGYLSLQVKQLVKGREPRGLENDDGESLAGSLFIASMLQGGGLGLYGDFLFGEASRTGLPATVSTFMGPAVGDAEKLFSIVNKAVWGDDEERVDAGGDAVRFAITSAPGANLFYTRWALDYLVLYRMQEAMSPGYLERYERRVEKREGAGFILDPSEAVTGR